MTYREGIRDYISPKYGYITRYNLSASLIDKRIYNIERFEWKYGNN